ncbi:MAG: phosphoribosylanthranilate isomerase [Magnetococcus sp. DMHC-8]
MGRTRVKVCGITRREDAEAAEAAGADALGFVFYAGSSRYVAPEVAAAIAATIPPFLTRVGLFVNASCAEIVQTVALGFLHTIQLHGNETPAFCQQLCAELGTTGPLPTLIKAVRVATRTDLHALSCWPVQAILLDAKVDNRYGGTGRSFDWSLLADWPRLLPGEGAAMPWILAGGLTPDNVAAAIRQVRPYAVDVSSGVEQAPGRKSAEQMMRFIQQVRVADQDWSDEPDSPWRKGAWHDQAGQ